MFKSLINACLVMLLLHWLCLQHSVCYFEPIVQFVADMAKECALTLEHFLSRVESVEVPSFIIQFLNTFQELIDKPINYFRRFPLSVISSLFFFHGRSMTVNYNGDVANSTFGSFLKVLGYWRGSVWKACKGELVLWLIFYYIIAFVYRVVLNEAQKKNFEDFAHHFESQIAHIPLNFILGFFVTSVIGRWKKLTKNLGQIDNLALTVANLIKGTDDHARKVRRTIVRYCCLAQVLVFRDVSTQVRQRFPQMQSLVDGRVMLPHELRLLEQYKYGYHKSWIPIQWAMQLAYRSRFLSDQDQKAGRKPLLQADGHVNMAITEIKSFYASLMVVFNCDRVPVPLMYPQLVSIAVHTHFIIYLCTRQFTRRTTFDLYFPLTTVLQLLFYFGWMKVAEALLNPFGEDDDDFETNYVIDRNFAMGLATVDPPPNSRPALDGATADIGLPAEEKGEKGPWKGSVSDMKCSRGQMSCRSVQVRHRRRRETDRASDVSTKSRTNTASAVA